VILSRSGGHFYLAKSGHLYLATIYKVRIMYIMTNKDIEQIQGEVSNLTTHGLSGFPRTVAARPDRILPRSLGGPTPMGRCRQRPMGFPRVGITER
jgi:hypothetical protein